MIGTKIKEKNYPSVLILKKKSWSIGQYEDPFIRQVVQFKEKRNYDRENPVVVAGYTAKQIHELNPGFEGIGVYNFMITLRDHPERANKYIESGFKEL